MLSINFPTMKTVWLYSENLIQSFMNLQPFFFFSFFVFLGRNRIDWLTYRVRHGWLFRKLLPFFNFFKKVIHRFDWDLQISVGRWWCQYLNLCGGNLRVLIFPRHQQPSRKVNGWQPVWPVRVGWSKAWSVSSVPPAIAG